MKKLFSLIAAIAIVLTLAACEGETVYVDKIVEKEVIVYEEKIVYEDKIIEVTVPVEIEVPVPVEVEVPADVENERFYKPGVYFNNTEVDTEGVYTYTVVVVDAYGKIAGIMYDDTNTTSEFLTDGEKLYVYVPGDQKTVPNTYRLIADNTPTGAYPDASWAITADDLVMGIHQAAIAELTPIAAYETSRILNAEWIGKTDALVERIMEDQSTYGIVTSSAGEGVVAVNVDTDLDNVDVLMALVQDILDGDAALTEEVELATTPVYGLYTEGFEFGQTARLIGSSVSYYTSFVVVDQYGRIAGVFNDATSSDKVNEGAYATKQILGSAYGIDWFAHANAFSDAIVKNQGTDFVVLSELEEGQKHQYTDQIAGVTIGAEGLVEATSDALGELTEYVFTDGTYFVAGEGEAKHAFMYVTIADGALESILLDNTQGTDQVTVTREDDVFPVFTFTREWTVAGEEKSAEVLVYQDGEDYYPVVEVTVAGETLDVDDEIEFVLDEENGVDEMATIEIVAGYYTKQMLGDAYGMNPENNWYAQADALTDAFVAGNSPYAINLTEDGHTDVTGVTFGHIEEYQQMLIEALLLAVDTENNNELFDTDAVSALTKLADGTYFAAGETDIEGAQPFAWMNVVDGMIETVVFDSTMINDAQITTFTSMGDALGLADDEDDDEWYEEAAMYATEILTAQDAIVTPIEGAFDYADKLEFGTYAAVYPVVSYDFFDEVPYETLVANLVEQAVEAKIAEEATRVLTEIEDSFADFYVETTSNFAPSTAATLEVNGTAEVFTVTWETADEDIIDVNSDDITWEFQDIDADSEVALTATVELSDVEFTKDFVISVYTDESNQVVELNDNDTFFVNYTTITDVHPLVLDRDTATYPVIKWWDNDEDQIIAADYTHAGIDTDEDDETVTLTAWIDTDGDNVVDYDETSRDFVITVKDEASAIAEVQAMVMPGNILDEVTATSVSDLTLDEDVMIGGIAVTWDETTGGNGQLSLTDDVLTITRLADDTHEVTLSAFVNGGNKVDFDFFVVEADTAMVQGRMEAVVGLQEDFVLPVMYLDTDTAIDATQALYPVAYDFLADDAYAAIAWELDDDATATIDAAGVLTYNDGQNETVTVTVTFTCTQDADVEFTRTATIVLFDNN